MDAKKIADLAATLKAESETLNEASPSVNELVELAEAKLREANPGIEEWLPDLICPTETEPLTAAFEFDASEAVGSQCEAYQIGYARVSGSDWGLAARTVQKQTLGGGYRFDSDSRSTGIYVTPWHRVGTGKVASATAEKEKPEQPLVVPLRNAPLDVRIAALGKLPELFTRLTKRVRAMKETIGELTKQLK